MRPIFLIGYMGCGKTTLARALSRATGLEVIDLDFYIENRFRRSVRDIFASEGEERFRRIEACMLREVGEFEDVVIACGGGTPCFAGNMDYMNSRGETVLLEATLPVLHSRLVKGKFKRPLIAGKTDDEILAVIERGLHERGPYYGQARHRFCSDLLENRDQIASSVETFMAMMNLKPRKPDLQTPTKS